MCTTYCFIIGQGTLRNKVNLRKILMMSVFVLNVNDMLSSNMYHNRLVTTKWFVLSCFINFMLVGFNLKIAVAA